MGIELGARIYNKNDGPDYYGVLYKFINETTAEVHYAKAPPRLSQRPKRRKGMWVPRFKESVLVSDLVLMAEVDAANKAAAEEERLRKKEENKVDERISMGKSIKNSETGAVYTFGQRGRRPEWVADYVKRIQGES